MTELSLTRTPRVRTTESLDERLGAFLARLERGADLARERFEEILQDERGIWSVPDRHEQDVRYAVDPADHKSCPCEDSTLHDRGCEHYFAIRAIKYEAARCRVPDHEMIRRDAAAHPERTYSEHVEAARRMAAQTYRDDLARISPAAQAALSRELETEEMAL